MTWMSAYGFLVALALNGNCIPLSFYGNCLFLDSSLFLS